MWESFVLPTLTSVIGSWLIIGGFYLYHRKRQTDAGINETTRLTNEITNLNGKFENLNDKFENLNAKIDNLYTRVDNGFEILTFEMDKLHTDVETNTKRIDIIESTANNNSDVI